MRLFGGIRQDALSIRLHGIGLLSALSPRELRIVGQLLHIRSYIAGEIVFDAGDEGQAMYFVLDGRIDICPQGEPEAPIATLAAGSYFGEMALLDDSHRSAQARVASDAELGVLFRGDFLGLLDTHAAIASKISLQLARDLGSRLRDVLPKNGK
jgi:CRP-like cAMP-binding protein